jgi:mycothiol synthase
VEPCSQLTESELSEVRSLLDAARVADQHAPLAEHKLLDLSRAGTPRKGFTAFLHRSAAGALDGYAQLSDGHGGSGLEVVVHPVARTDEAEIAHELLTAAVDAVARSGGGRLQYWMSDPSPERLSGAASIGFAPGRRLLQMRVELPLPPAVAEAPRRGDHNDPPPLRAFRPGVDEEEWLEVNNRAFAEHPEQGGWDLDTLLSREGEGWFDPEGFLVADEDGRMAGSCWTKIHDTDPPMGEIYVISVDPRLHHRGLGRALTVAGLDWLAARGLRLAMLYVDGANTAAVRLYESLGFAVDHVDVAYVLDVPAA